MPSAAKKKKKAKKPSKSTAKKRKAIGIILGLFVVVILCGEAVFFMKGQINIPRDYPVQLTVSFKGDNQACGPFSPWDIKSGADWIAMTDQPRERILIFDLAGHYLRQIDTIRGQTRFQGNFLLGHRRTEDDLRHGYLERPYPQL